MNEDTRNPNHILGGRVIWIIDDEFQKVLSRPELSHLRDDEMMEGTRPIDRGTLKGLLAVGDWDDANVRDLCEQCVGTAADVVAFTQPSSAIHYLSSGVFAPDVIVFDLVYDSFPTDTKPLAQLDELLRRCASLVQVYSGHANDFNDDLSTLQSKYSARLQSPVGKGETSAEQLAKALGDRLAGSLSTQLSSDIRRSTSMAVENVLVRIDDLPIDIAVKLLTGISADIPDDVELVDLISTKVGDVIKASSDLAESVNKYAHGHEIPSELVTTFVEEVVELLASNVRERIQYGGWLFDLISSAKESVRKSPRPDSSESQKTGSIIREFFSFRLYDRPSDSLVRTGDIVSMHHGESLEKDSPDLYLIITPACDLARFWKKTQGNLTMVKMRPATKDQGIKYLNSYEKWKGRNVTSVITQNPLVFASLPLKQDGFMDYLLFVHEISSLNIDGTTLWDEKLGKLKKEVYSSPLTYDQLRLLGQELRRYCRISEPFLSGVLSEIRNTLFRSGVPDYPDQEMTRLKSILAS